MSVDRRLINLGVFLLILGAIPLAVAQGWITRDTLSHVWDLWPLILIGIGIGLILRRTPLHFAGGVVVAATLATMFGALLAGGLSLSVLGCGNVAGATSPSVLDEHGTFAGATSTVVLRATCASVSVGPGPGAAWGVAVNGKAESRPTVSHEPGRLDVESPNQTVTVPFQEGRRSSWQVTLGTDATYALDFSLSAGDAAVDLEGLRLESLSVQGNGVSSRLRLHDATVGRLDMQVNAGDVKVGLPAGAALAGRIQANAASISLCADPGTGLRLRDTSTVTGNNFAAAGLSKTGSTWESPGVGSAAHVVDLELDGAAASFTLNPSEGCR